MNLFSHLTILSPTIRLSPPHTSAVVELQKMIIAHCDLLSLFLNLTGSL